MNEETGTAIPGWYKGVAIAALAWNLLGCVAFAMEMFAQEAMIESWTDAQKEWAQGIPGWIYVIFAMSVITGVGGSAGLLMRKGWSVLWLAICLVGVLVQQVYTMIIAGGLEVMGPSNAVMPAVVILLAGILLWFSLLARGKGWLVD